MSATTEPTPYLRPSRLDDALARLAEGGWSVLAGGTDFYPARVGREVREPLLDLGAIGALRGLGEGDVDGTPALRIGALTTWSELADAPLPEGLAALCQAAREVGGRQVQNQGTIGGNLCNASPAADGVPPLLALDAVVELASVRGTRRVALADFVVGNRRTTLGDGELLVAVLVPRRTARARSLFLKLGHRRYLVISIAMVALAADLDADGRVRLGAAVGACSAAARRLPALEARVAGMVPEQLRARAESLVDASVLAPLAPIDDVRASAAYRLDAARALLARGLAELGGQWDA
ncbi:MAG: FAD binding domain-containing protein [Burkholderiaceae bacterium]